jgi:hypothetical protein
MKFSDILNESIKNQSYAHWDSEALRVKKKVYILFKAFKKGGVSFSDLHQKYRYHYEFVDSLINDLKGLATTLKFTSSNNGNKVVILHPQLNLKDSFVKLSNADGTQVDMDQLDSVEKGIILHKIGDKFKQFDIKINWGYSK